MQTSWGPERCNSARQTSNRSSKAAVREFLLVGLQHIIALQCPVVHSQPPRSPSVALVRTIMVATLHHSDRLIFLNQFHNALCRRQRSCWTRACPCPRTTTSSSSRTPSTCSTPAAPSASPSGRPTSAACARSRSASASFSSRAGRRSSCPWARCRRTRCVHQHNMLTHALGEVCFMTVCSFAVNVRVPCYGERPTGCSVLRGARGQ